MGEPKGAARHISKELFDCLDGTLEALHSHPALTRGWLHAKHLTGYGVRMTGVGLGNLGLGPGVFVGIVWLALP